MPNKSKAKRLQTPETGGTPRSQDGLGSEVEYTIETAKNREREEAEEKRWNLPKQGAPPGSDVTKAGSNPDRNIRGEQY